MQGMLAVGRGEWIASEKSRESELAAYAKFSFIAADAVIAEKRRTEKGGTDAKA